QTIALGTTPLLLSTGRKSMCRPVGKIRLSVITLHTPGESVYTPWRARCSEDSANNIPCSLLSLTGGRGISSQVRPSSSLPARFLLTPPHCLKKNGTLALRGHPRKAGQIAVDHVL